MNPKQTSPVEAFLNRIQQDTQLRRQLERIKGSATARMDAIIRIATEAGYSFTRKEYEEAKRAQSATTDAEGRKFADKDCSSAIGCAS
jgi:predicted ribosomally synthesized peptide with nif11-like leader